MRPCERIVSTSRCRSPTAKATRLGNIIDPGSTSRTFGRAIAAIRDFCRAPSERCRDLDRQRQIFSFGAVRQACVAPT
jgi:hypothetical protein